mgnify:CR=1 FL=1
MIKKTVNLDHLFADLCRKQPGLDPSVAPPLGPQAQQTPRVGDGHPFHSRRLAHASLRGQEMTNGLLAIIDINKGRATL